MCNMSPRDMSLPKGSGQAQSKHERLNYHFHASLCWRQARMGDSYENSSFNPLYPPHAGEMGCWGTPPSRRKRGKAPCGIPFFILRSKEIGRSPPQAGAAYDLPARGLSSPYHRLMAYQALPSPFRGCQSPATQWSGSWRRYWRRSPIRPE